MQLYIRHFRLFLSISAVGMILPFCGSLVEVFYPHENMGIMLMFLPASIALYIMSLMALIAAIGKTTLGENVSFSMMMIAAWGRIWRGIGGYLLFSLLIGLGIVLLIVPAVYWWTVFTFYLFIIILEDARPWASLRRSDNLVKGEFWTVLRAHGLILLMTVSLCLPVFIGMYLLWMPLYQKKIITGLLGIVLPPFYFCYYYQIYDYLRRQKDGHIKIHESLASRNPS